LRFAQAARPEELVVPVDGDFACAILSDTQRPDLPA
jgi:hypothetical protein